ncbi:MAG: histidinol dehydrogenase [Nitrososphaerota archaeon]|nr:histidinol dehydrogenase [Candidatus Bathyarchaeota archaeon]MDW8048488.1 histidinol dehydrogenase [Nitrososphaerota archaeon]
MDALQLSVQRISSAYTKIMAQRWPKAKFGDFEAADYVRRIIEDVRMRGDKALLEYTAKFDNVELPRSSIKVERSDVEKAYSNISGELVRAIEFAKKRIERFQNEILARLNFEYLDQGTRIRSCLRPIQRVGCYIPGGQAAYPSSVVMTVAPAKIAGVNDIILCSPPRKNGEIDPAILVAADICGSTEIYRVGGVAAIAAMAYGTETIRPVEKIVGPGGKYVTLAKMLVSKDVPIDFPAGPSEIVIYADETADAKIVASDMISQVEHSDGIAILVTISRRFAESVAEEINSLILSLKGDFETIYQNLSKNCMLLVGDSVDEAVRFINDFAPEHLELMTEDAWSLSEKIRSSGLVTIGKYTPVAATDYCLGTNHILPTGGFSRVYSGLSILNFMRHLTIIEANKETLLKCLENVRVLAEAEGLINHALAISRRFDID